MQSSKAAQRDGGTAAVQSNFTNWLLRNGVTAPALNIASLVNPLYNRMYGVVATVVIRAGETIISIPRALLMVSLL